MSKPTSQRDRNGVATTRALAKGFVERATAQGLKGKRRDDAVLDYFCGAYIALKAIGETDCAHHVGTITGLVLATRGYDEVVRLANLKDEIKC